MISDAIAIAQEARIADLLDRIADKDRVILEKDLWVTELEGKLAATRAQLLTALEAQA